MDAGMAQQTADSIQMGTELTLVAMKPGLQVRNRLMPTTDTSEKGFETLIVDSLVGEAGNQQGESSDYDRDHAVDRTFSGFQKYMTRLYCI